jgi:hypothetical protein
MSKISIAGAATGTATFTIESPATSTNRTITLADATGTMVVSGTTPSLNGITFPATQVASAGANTLDDYEEGTWTPAIRGAATAGTYQLATANGKYTKIGNQVTIWGNFAFAGSITGGGTSYMQITGIPFANSNPAIGSVAHSGLDITTNYTWLIVSPTGSANVTTWFLSENGDNVASSDFPISGVSANDNVSFTATYQV